MTDLIFDPETGVRIAFAYLHPTADDAAFDDWRTQCEAEAGDIPIGLCFGPANLCAQALTKADNDFQRIMCRDDVKRLVYSLGYFEALIAMLTDECVKQSEERRSAA